jgi:L-threonylcarbamoyladenylate synthase
MEKLIEQEIENSVRMLNEGKVLLYPTDTIWGLGCDATNSKAVDKIFKIKKRKKSKSMIILLDSLEKVKNYADEVPPFVYDLVEQINTPLTIIYQNAKNLAKNLIPSDRTIAIRIVKGEYCSEMIKRFGKPVVSTSANISGVDPPITFDEISPEIIKSVDYAVKIFRDRIKSVKPSTIIKLESDGLFKIIRQ